VKGINQWYNKRPCKSRAKKRYFRLENYFHHTAKMIIDLCVENGIGAIIIGKNDGWKREVRMRRKTKQSFLFVPHESLIGKIRYRAEMVGIEVILTEEAYTSKASFYDHDPLPLHGEVPPKFSGRRKHRGLYISKDGFAINADVNASLNIGRKVIPEFLGIGDRSVAATPVIVNPLKGWSEKDHPADDPNREM
jgi:IS605 OrfB family transposase